LEGTLLYHDARDQRATPPDGGYGRSASTADDRDAAARSFYEDVLQGRQVWPTDFSAADGGLWFLVGGTLVEVRADPAHAAAAIVLDVDAPDEVAARCWGAGSTVRVHDDASGQVVLSVLDPFGREIVLAGTHVSAGSASGAVGE
jgi:catechol 2,3-dioxygenase-like lactoylglutathione lyase family enzyme